MSIDLAIVREVTQNWKKHFIDLYHEYAIKHALVDANIGICHEIENKNEYSD